MRDGREPRLGKGDKDHRQFVEIQNEIISNSKLSNPESLKDMGKEDMGLFILSFFVAGVGLLYVLFCNIFGFVWHNRRYMTIRNLRIAFFAFAIIFVPVFIAGRCFA